MALCAIAQDVHDQLCPHPGLLRPSTPTTTPVEGMSQDSLLPMILFSLQHPEHVGRQVSSPPPPPHFPGGRKGYGHVLKTCYKKNMEWKVETEISSYPSQPCSTRSSTSSWSYNSSSTASSSYSSSYSTSSSSTNNSSWKHGQISVTKTQQGGGDRMRLKTTD